MRADSTVLDEHNNGDYFKRCTKLVERRREQMSRRGLGSRIAAHQARRSCDTAVDVVRAAADGRAATAALILYEARRCMLHGDDARSTRKGILCFCVAVGAARRGGRCRSVQQGVIWRCKR